MGFGRRNSNRHFSTAKKTKKTVLQFKRQKNHSKRPFNAANLVQSSKDEQVSSASKISVRDDEIREDRRKFRRYTVVFAGMSTNGTSGQPEGNPEFKDGSHHHDGSIIITENDHHATSGIQAGRKSEPRVDESDQIMTDASSDVSHESGGSDRFNNSQRPVEPADGCQSLTGIETEASNATSKCEEEQQDEYADYPRIGSKNNNEYALLTKTDSSSNGGTTAVIHLKSKEMKTCQRISSKQRDHFLNLRDRLYQFSAPRSGNCGVGIGERHEIEHQKQQMKSSIVDAIIPSGTEIIYHDGQYVLISPKHFGSLHSYVQGQKKLSEDETRGLFGQIVQMVAYCHSVGVVVRDLKLRKFVFANGDRTALRMCGVSELVVCERDDALKDRHGCPAYASPEILDLTRNTYGGKAADIWSLGVLMFVMLLGRYPFYDTTPSGLFAKIRAGHFGIRPEEEGHDGGRTTAVGLECRMLLHCLLRQDPNQRPTATQLANAGWLRREGRPMGSADSDRTATENALSRTATEHNQNPQNSTRLQLVAIEAAKLRRHRRGIRLTSTARSSLSVDPTSDVATEEDSDSADQVVPEVPSIADVNNHDDNEDSCQSASVMSKIVEEEKQKQAVIVVLAS